MLLPLEAHRVRGRSHIAPKNVWKTLAALLSPFFQSARAVALRRRLSLLSNHAEHLGLMPHVFVADGAFPLRRHMMRPHPGQNIGREKRLYNYRLSRARRMVECSFGILAAQWRLYRRVLGVIPEMAEKAAKGYLHPPQPSEGRSGRGPSTSTVIRT